MSSSFDSRQALTAMISVLTSYTSATALSTSTFATSMANQVTADTGLTSGEAAIITAVTSAIGSVTPSTSIHKIVGAIDTRTLYGAMTSILTALTSAQGLSTSTLATNLSSMLNADAGLTNQEKALVTLFTSAIGNTQPSSSAHSQV